MAPPSTSTSGSNGHSAPSAEQAEQAPAPAVPAPDSQQSEAKGNGILALSKERDPRERLADCRVIRRNGEVVPFNDRKIFDAIMKAFVANSQDAEKTEHDTDVRELVERVCDSACASLSAQIASESTLLIEQIQDQVELALMRSEHYKVAKGFMLYRQQRQESRQQRADELLPRQVTVVTADGRKILLDPIVLHERIESACAGLSEAIEPDMLINKIVAGLYEGITTEKLDHLMVLEAATLSELEPDYLYVAARILLGALCKEIFGEQVKQSRMVSMYPAHLSEMIRIGVEAKVINPDMERKFNLAKLGKAIIAENDLKFSYVGLQTVYDRYLLKANGKRIELPQSFLMRVAMGLALNEDQPTERAIEFYNLLSNFLFMSSTPTLFNAGTMHSQLSSCYLSTVGDDLGGIFKAIKDNALLAKYAGGLGNDWTPVRSQGSFIKGTGGNSQGVVPFLRVVNDTAVAVNQGGKRKGAVCCYLESWHRDIREFLELRKNTGDERRRAHDMNTANWLPDLFFKRVKAQANWTLFSPSDVPDLHDLYGAEFEKAYEEYERQAQAGEIDGEQIPALDLWKKMLAMLYETGHPWITFKDPCNIRSPQGHAGVVHSSNLCTEITLNTSADEIAVCNLGSVNLPAHLKDGELDVELLASTIKTAMRMLDNVIDINYYAVDEARNSNMRHRPVGLGIMGFQDCLYEMGINYDSQEAVEFADSSAELIAYHAYQASSDLATERGKYESYEGSLWSKGVLPLDSLALLARARSADCDTDPNEAGELDTPYLKINVSKKLDWNKLRAKILKDGMRNSNCMAIAPTATIANIVGVTASIEPCFQNLFVKSNLSGEFKMVNSRMVRELQKLGLWDSVMLSEIKQADGEIKDIERIPEPVRMRYATAFNIAPKWLVEAAARRQKWIDQSQSLNLYVSNPRGRDLSEIYMLAWERGLKTTYYMRSTQASSTEKYSTESTGNLNAVQVPPASACNINDPDCESCAG